jgi:cobalt-zinc-cadmium efflux system membrane fusion protein
MERGNAMKRIKAILAVVLLSCGLLANCTPKESKTTAAPSAKVDNRIKESDLTRVTLSAEAERRLGLELAAVVERTASDQMRVAGEVVPIPGKTLIVTAPISGFVTLAREKLIPGQTVTGGEAIFHLTPLLAAQRDLRVTYEADLRAARARLHAATQQLKRAQQLLRDMADSKRNVETAEQEFGQAKAAYDVADLKLKRLATHPLEADVAMTITAPFGGIIRQIQVAPGQNVTAGVPLFEIADFNRVWLRVPVYAGDLNQITASSIVSVHDVDGAGPRREAVGVAAPPTADPLAVTADLYFEIANPDLQLRPGQRLTVVLPLRARVKRGVVVPTSAILYDVYGGAWVYVKEAAHVYRRHRVELVATEGQTAFVSRGIGRGSSVVAQGAAELFGTEFGAGH